MRHIEERPGTRLELEYSEFDGDYSRYPVAPNLNFGDFMGRYVATRPAEANRRTICMDAGSGIGWTIRQNALARREEVKAGKMGFVATTLNDGALKFVASIPVQRKRNEATALVVDTADLVHDIVTDFEGDQDYSITLPDGTSVNLEGAVTFLHDLNGPTRFTRSPAALCRLGSLVASDGIYMVGAPDVQCAKGLLAGQTHDLVSRGFTSQTLRDTYGFPTYVLHVGPDAPPVDLSPMQPTAGSQV